MYTKYSPECKRGIRLSAVDRDNGARQQEQEKKKNHAKQTKSGGVKCWKKTARNICARATASGRSQHFMFLALTRADFALTPSCVSVC